MPDLVPTTDAARALGISPRTLQRYVQRGLLTPALTLPGLRREYRWDLDDLKRQLAALSE